MEDDCDCLEEQRKREKAAAPPPAVSEARGQRKSSADEACTPTCRAAVRPGPGSGPARSPGFFSRLLGYFTRGGQRPRPIPHDCLNPKTNAQRGRNPIVALLTFIMGSVLLYVAFAYLLCAMKKYELRARLVSILAVLSDPCAIRNYVNDLFNSVVTRITEASAGISLSSGSSGSSGKACKPKPKPACT